MGIDLEPEAEEKYVGPFRADLLCKNTADDSWVVIENQIEGTDHKHLGQLLTYAAGLKAVTIIWIAAKFRDEHREALDWLNETTHDSVRFFGIEIELWKIGSSPAAPNFKIISQPNDWANDVRESANAITDFSRSQQLRLKYWTGLRDYLQENKSKLRTQKPGRDHWYNFSIGTSLAHLSALLITREDKIGVEVQVKTERAKEIYADLIKDKQSIEERIGATLEWRELPDKKVSRILLFKPSDPYNETDWPVQFAWLRATLEKFDAVFRPSSARIAVIGRSAIQRHCMPLGLSREAIAISLILSHGAVCLISWHQSPHGGLV